MTKAANEDDELNTWQTLAAPTARFLIRSEFYKKQNERRRSDTNASDADEQNSHGDRENIDHSLSKRRA
jgi:hypothetical protein